VCEVVRVSTSALLRGTMTLFAAAFVVYLVYLLRRPMSWLLIAGFHVSSTRSSASVGLSAARPWLRSHRLSGDTDAGGLYPRIWAAQLALLRRASEQ
jgi:hypothetical protein